MGIKPTPSSVLIGQGQPLGSGKFSIAELGLSHSQRIGISKSFETPCDRIILPKQSLAYVLMGRSRASGEFVSQLGEVGKVRASGSLEFMLGGARDIVENEADLCSEVIVKGFRTGTTGVKRMGSDPTLVVADQFTVLHVALVHLRLERLAEEVKKQGRRLPHVVLDKSMDSVYAVLTLVAPVIKGGEFVESNPVRFYNRRLEKQITRTFPVNVGGELWAEPSDNYKDMVAFLRRQAKQSTKVQKENKPVETDTADVIEAEEPF